MLRWFRTELPARRWRYNLQVLKLDNDRSKVIFNHYLLHEKITTDARRRSDGDPGQKPSSTPRSNKSNGDCLVYNSLPPAPMEPGKADEANSSLCPPFHIHLKENETFHVLTGTAKFLLHDASQSKTDVPQEHGLATSLVSSGCSITIPRGQIHTFRNASKTERLELEFGFASSANISQTALNRKMHNFFLNTQLYRSDCASRGIERSLLQVLLFNHHADVALVPRPLLEIHRCYPLFRSTVERVAPLIGRVMNVLGGVVLGHWLCGLKPSYEEYVKEVSISQIIAQVNEEIATIQQELADTEAQLRNLGAARQNSHLPDSDEEPRPLVCQAWKNHSFDGQQDSWR